MSDEHHHHEAPANPYHESARTEEKNKELSDKVEKIESLLLEKGLVSKDGLDKLVDIYENDLGPMNGARMVARAWVDAEYKKRLMENATAAAGELGFSGMQGEHMIAVENSAKVHNVVVCTLCSCYPWPILGLPPMWYKSSAYRSKIVIEPRTVLSEFGTTLDDDVEVRVWDSSAEIRYLVIPERPAGTENMSEEELAGLVDRDAMIGVSKAQEA
jgi:nitrile hydratase